MITPRFELSQDDDFLYIIIDAVLAKISDTEIFVDEDEFCFYSTPYYLRLHLPGSIVEDGNESCTYEEGKFSLQISKKVPGEFFSGLDMITSLLTPKGQKTAKLPLIEVLSSTDVVEDGPDNGNPTPNAEEEFSWFVKRDDPESTKGGKIDEHFGYGFANQRSCVFAHLDNEFSSVIDIKNPDQHSTRTRMEQKWEMEKGKFDPDHFIADFIDDEKRICWMCDYLPPWVQVWKESQEKGLSFQSVIELTADEKYKLTLLPKKEHLIDDPAILTSVYLGLADILFAYCYDVRTNEGEKNMESGWTLAKLSSVMSCLVAFIDLKDVVVSSFRRCLSYPLYRSWKLNMLVLSDLTILLKAGRLQILKCLLTIKDTMQEYELNHILNDLYITDYCVWIQTADVKLLESLADHMSKILLKPADCDLELNCWEDIAIGELEEDSDGGTVQIVSSMSQLKIGKGEEEEEKKKKVRKHKGEGGNGSSSSSVDSDDDSCADSDDDDSSSSSSDDDEEESDSSSSSSEEEEEKGKEKVGGGEKKCVLVQEVKGEEEVLEKKVAVVTELVSSDGEVTKGEKVDLPTTTTGV